MTPRKRLSVLKRGSLCVKRRRSFNIIAKRRQKEVEMALNLEHEAGLKRRRMSTSARKLQKSNKDRDKYRDMYEKLAARFDHENAYSDEDEKSDAHASGDSETGSADPNDYDYDPRSDSDSNLRNHGVIDVMRRAALFKTTHNLLTGHSVEQFESLAQDLKAFIINTTLKGELCAAERTDVDHWPISPKMQLFITLVWARRYPPFAFLAFFFQLPARYVAKVIRRVTAAGARWAEGRLRLPETAAEAAALVKDHEAIQHDNYCKQVLNLDGTPIRVKTPVRPRDMTPLQKAEYNALYKKLTNAKHHVRAVNVLIITDMRGRILWLKGPYIGTEGAQLAECKPALRAHLRRLDLPIASDAGFVMNDTDVPENEWCTHYQTVGPSMIRLTKFVVDNHQYFDSDKVDFFQRIYDSTRYISQGRSVVEHTIGHLKTFAVFRETWRGRIEGHDELGLYSARLSHVVQFIGAVVSRCINDTPKRDSNFKLGQPVGAKHYYGYPNNVPVQKLITLAARKFIPGVKGENSSRSVVDALKVAQRMAAEQKRAMEEGDVHVAKKARRSVKFGTKAMLPDIVPPEEEEPDGDDTIYAANVDPDEDDDLVFRSKGRENRLQSKKEAEAKLAIRRERLRKIEKLPARRR
jgi:hypothetical protein